MSLLQAGFGSSGDDTYEITDSLRLRSSASAYLSRTPASDGNRQIFTFSAWVKRGTLGAENVIFHAGTASTNRGHLRFNSDDTCEWAYYNGSWILWLKTNAVFRDPSAWYHIVGRCNTTNGTSNLYINGVDQTSLSQNSKPSGSQSTSFGQTVEHQLGQRGFGDSGYLDGYMTEANFIDGQALDADDFGEYDDNGTWKAKEYTGTYGTNGFYLPMKPTTQAEGFNTVLYAGNTQAMNVTGVGFSPDFVWIKNRLAGNPHYLYDSVRGVNKSLQSNATTVEDGYPYQLTSFDADGFSLPTDTAGYNNYAGREYVAWCWDAGSGSAASNTDGSITSTVKASDSYGFSIVSYTGNGTSGATIGHGLSSAPKMIIVKNRTTAGADWPVYHEDTGNTGATYLNTTAAFATDSTRWNNTSPTSTVFSVGNGQGVNHSSASLIAYCFSEVAGYSKIGSYQNNNSTSGVTVTTGFRPAFIILKCTDAGERWFILDNARQVNNVSPPSTAWLVPNDTAAEGANGATTATIDFLDNGFQIKTTDPSTGEVSFGTRTYIYMAFADTRDAKFNFDASGNKNNWTPNNINSNGESATTYDLMKDTPSLVDENAANFATLNPLDTTNSATAPTNGNLTAPTNTGAYRRIGSTIQLPSSGKWYFETHCDSFSSFATFAVGLAQKPFDTAGGNSVGTLSTEWGYNGQSGTLVNNNTAISSSVNTVTTNDIMQIAYDGSTGKVWFGKNNTWQGSGSPNPATDTAPNYTGVYDVFPVVVQNWAAMSINFGQRPFAYTPPTGFLKLNTFNLPDSTIEDGSDYFNTVLYSGNSSTQSITGVGFQPDFVWAKDRTNVVHHTLNDAVRGVNLDLFSSSASQESNDHAGLTAFTADGYNLSSSTNHNVTGHTYVGWNWLAGNSTSTNTAGSVNSTVSVNTTAGFSIVSFAAQSGTYTVGHGLNSPPEIILGKNRNINGGPWYSFTTAIDGGVDYLSLNTTAAAADAEGFGITAPTSTVFTGGSAFYYTTGNMITYCFHSVEGYSKIGKYTGNGSTDGPFVYTGFRPAMIIIKRVDTTNNWLVHDNKRDPYNQVVNILFPNLASAESAGTASNYGFDFVSNGFKAKGTTGGGNDSGGSYIYMAFAENPFKNALAR